jgi:hypothetical protein
MAQMRKTPKGQSPLGPGKFIGTKEADKARELKRIKEGKPTYVGKPARSKSGASTVAAVAKRFGVTAREARDIATAVGTAVQSARNPNVLGTKAKVGSPTRPTAGNVLKKQIKETITAAKTGKKGTTSPKLSDTGKKSTLDSGRTMPVFKYQEGKKRK